MKKKCEILLLLLIASFPSGSLLFDIDLGIGHIYCFRIVLVVSFFFLLIKKSLVFYHGKYTKIGFFLLVIWLFYAGLSSLWAAQPALAYLELAHLAKALLLYVVFISLSLQCEDGLKVIQWSWILGLFITILIAFFEIQTNQHIVGRFTEMIKDMHPGHRIFRSVISVFSGPNEYSVYLAISIPFLFYKTIRRHSFFAYLIILFALFVIYMNDAKISIIAVFLQGVLLSLFYFFWMREKLLHYFKTIEVRFSTVIVMLFLINFVFSVEFSRNPYYDKEEYSMIESFDQNLSSKVLKEVNRGNDKVYLSSMAIRKGLILNGLWFLKESNFIGVGAGNFPHHIKTSSPPYSTGIITQPHSWWIEILSQYGVPIFILYFGFLGSIGVFLVKKRKLMKENESLWRFGMLFLVTFLICSNASSVFLNNPINWICFVIITLVADELHLITKKEETAELA